MFWYFIEEMKRKVPNLEDCGKDYVCVITFKDQQKMTDVKSKHVIYDCSNPRKGLVEVS